MVVPPPLPLILSKLLLLPIKDPSLLIPLLLLLLLLSLKRRCCSRGLGSVMGIAEAEFLGYCPAIVDVGTCYQARCDCDHHDITFDVTEGKYD